MPMERVGYDADLTAILNIFRGLQDGRPVHEGSDTFTQASVQAALTQDVRKTIAYVADQIHPDTADTEHLERHAALKTGIYRKPPSGASGTVTLTGNAGAVAEAGLELTDEQGQTYQTTEAAVLDQDGQAVVAAQAVSTGVSTRLAAGAQLTLVSPPLGLAGTASVLTAWEGGSDQESDAELLARHLWKLRHPIAGGNKYDYITWATSVPGVYEAYHFPRRRGLGTNDTVILVDTPDRLPGQALIDAVQAVIDAQRPAGLKDAKAMAPDTKAVDVTASITLESGYTLAEVTSRIQADLTAFFAALPPGEDLPLSRLQTIISMVEGVADRNVTAPAANVTATVDETTLELLTLGTVTITEAT